MNPQFADTFNALFEFFGTFFILFSIFKLHKDKLVRGISFIHVGFWSAWGYWNIYYYWAINSPLSWWAGIGVTVVNTIYLLQLIHYTRREKEARVWHDGMMRSMAEGLERLEGPGVAYTLEELDELDKRSDSPHERAKDAAGFQ